MNEAVSLSILHKFVEVTLIPSSTVLSVFSEIKNLVILSGTHSLFVNLVLYSQDGQSMLTILIIDSRPSHTPSIAHYGHVYGTKLIKLVRISFN